MQPHPPAEAKTKLSNCGEAACKFLPWDSQFFGCRIASVEGHRLTGGALFDIEQWCKASQIDCLYFLTDFEDQETIRLAEENLFRLVDIRLTLTATLPDLPGVPSSAKRVRLGNEHDIPALRSIARSSHTSTRFYFDASFPRARCDALYETWIEKSCRGYADVVFVPELNGRPVGYLSCHLRPDGTGNIGLVGLAFEARGMEIGAELVQAAQNWFLERRVRQVTVVTQGRNLAAQRLYQRCGFCTHALELWYHRWFTHSQRRQSDSLQDPLQ